MGNKSIGVHIKYFLYAQRNGQKFQPRDRRTLLLTYKDSVRLVHSTCKPHNDLIMRTITRSRRETGPSAQSTTTRESWVVLPRAKMCPRTILSHEHTADVEDGVWILGSKEVPRDHRPCVTNLWCRIRTHSQPDVQLKNRKSHLPRSLKKNHSTL